jgi:two-component system LytT family response regulator
VDMPKMTGIEFAKAIKGRSKIILCTAYPEYGAVSYEHDVVDYLLKPVDYPRFFQAVEKATRLVTAGQPSSQTVQSEFMMLKTGTKFTRINFEDIVYLSADRHYTKFQLTQKTVTHFVLLKDIVEKLPPKQFVRVHHSFVIAINKIEQLDKNTIRLKNCETPIPVSETYRPRLMKILNAMG